MPLTRTLPVPLRNSTALIRRTLPPHSIRNYDRYEGWMPRVVVLAIAIGVTGCGGANASQALLGPTLVKLVQRIRRSFVAASHLTNQTAATAIVS